MTHPFPLVKRITALFAAVLATAFLVAGCGSTADNGPTEKVTVRDYHGDVEMPKNPKRVVVFDYGALDTFDKVGIKPEKLAIPKDIMPSYLEKYKDDASIENVGSPKDLDFEKISNMKPDLIIINGRQEPSYEELKKIAPTLDLSFDENDYLPSFHTTMDAIGKIFGKENELEEALMKIDSDVESLKQTADASNMKGLFLMTTGGKIHVFGKGSRYGLLYNALDLKSAIETHQDGAASHGEVATNEYIVQTDPDYILVLDRDSAIDQKGAAKQLLDNDLVNGTKTAKNGKILYLDPGLWYLGGNGLESVELQLDAIRPIFR